MLIIVVIILVIVIIVATIREKIQEMQSLRMNNKMLSEEIIEKKKDIKSVEEENKNLQQEKVKLESEIFLLKRRDKVLMKTIKEAPLGFPSLLSAIREHDCVLDKRLADWLITKKHPAYTAAEIVREETQKRRDAEYKYRQAKMLLDYYSGTIPDPKTQQETTENNFESESSLLEHRFDYYSNATPKSQKTTETTENSFENENSLLKHRLVIFESELNGLRMEKKLSTEKNMILTDEIQKQKNSINDLEVENKNLTQKNTEIEHENFILKNKLSASEEKAQQYNELLKKFELLKEKEVLLTKTINEAPLGFPSLLLAIAKYEYMQDKKLSDDLVKKSHPAYTAAERVREETRKRREAEYDCQQAKMLLEYYLNEFPEIKEIALEEKNDLEAPAKSEEEDIAERYLSREEYRELSVTERNQLALDRFWTKNKSKLLIGRLYEQYVGYLYEKDDWIVEYFGITEGFSDLGRDLICHKDNTTLIIQCKNWSKSKKIYEKHIFQLFGTMYEYRQKNPFQEVYGVFYTSTNLSDLARLFAKDFKIKLYENFALRRFPIIKCNIGREGERIYHLPFDQQYYRTKINKKDGDFYCERVAEAEAQGFRRAYRWHGNNDF